MSQVVFPPLERLRARRSTKWRHHPADVLPLWVAEMDVELAPPVQAALLQALTDSDTGYADNLPLAEAFAGFAGRHWGWDLDPARVVTTTDVAVGTTELLRRVLAPGDGVVLCPPVYPPFGAWLTEVGARQVTVPLLTDTTGTRHDLAGLRAAFAAGARAMLLCHPQNPTGQVFPAAELAQIAELAVAHDVLVVSDEIHAPLVLSGAEHVPYLTVSPAAARTGVALYSASKAWNLAGLKAAVLVSAHPARHEMLARIPAQNAWRTGHLGVLAGAVACTDTDSWLEDLHADLRARQQQLARLLAECLPRVRWTPGAATYLAWLDCRELGLGDDPAAVFLARSRVALSPGPPFGVGGDTGLGYARLNLATNPDVLDRAVRAMAGC